jgi:hypothetical protein
VGAEAAMMSRRTYLNHHTTRGHRLQV